jgi:hypothetical protein
MAKRKPVLPPDYDRLEGMHYLSAGKEMIAGPFATYDEALQAQDDQFPGGLHPESGAHIGVGYYPPRKTLRAWDRQDRSLNAFHVTYWQVVENRMMDGGGTLIGTPLSQKFSTKQKCRGALARIKGGKPRAYIARMTYLCHWGRLSEIEARKALLDEIRRGESSHAS